MATRTASARWNGNFTDGSGTMDLGGFSGAYSAGSRFEDADGTNPEELIAAAHAGCYSMALALALEQAGHAPESVETSADVHLNPAAGGGFEINRIDLHAHARVPGIEEAEFEELAEQTKQGCPVSKALGAVAEINLETELDA